MGLVIGEVIVSYVNLVINAWYSKALLGYTAMDQLRDIAPTLFMSFATGAMAIVLRDSLPLHGTPRLLVITAACMLAYIGMHKAIRTREWRLVTETVAPRAWRMINGAVRS